MPYREFQDSDGSVWNVWDVVPTHIDDMNDNARRETNSARSRGTHAPVDRALARGWLCFQRGEEKRRLAPIPAEWQALPETRLQELLGNATHVQRSSAAERAAANTNT